MADENFTTLSATVKAWRTRGGHSLQLKSRVRRASEEDSDDPGRCESLLYLADAEERRAGLEERQEHGAIVEASHGVSQ